jgi:hypothetical protein
MRVAPALYAQQPVAQTPQRRGRVRAANRQVRHLRLRRAPLTTLPGLIREAGRIYRKMKTRKINHEEGRSLIWSLSQIRPMLEAQALERIEARLEQLNAHAEARSGQLLSQTHLLE